MQHFRVAIIGAGISGIGMAIQLRRMGVESFAVFEHSHDIGGTWRDNTYPGVQCDVPSHLYSYSFAPKHDWTQAFAGGAEIQQYLLNCVERYDIRRHCRFGTGIRQARFDRGRWQITTESGAVFSADLLVSCVGGLHHPRMPDVPGLDTFGGDSFHTSLWRHDVDLRGKRIALVGTGASGVQCAPRLAEMASELYVVQRTPSWVGPKKNPPATAEEIEAFRRDPMRLKAHRWNLWNSWETNGFELLDEGSAINRLAERKAREHMQRQIKDPDLLNRLTPSYNYTCKRPTISNEYFPIFNQPHVHLVTDPVTGVERDGLLLANGTKLDVDVMVFATGFRSFDIANSVEIINSAGRSLSDAWKDSMTSYRTVMVPGFDNYFMVLGPNSFGVASAYQMIEAGVRFVADAIRYLDRHGLKTLAPRREPAEAFMQTIGRMFSTTTQNKGCRSWWTDDKGHNKALWPQSSVEYALMMRQLIPAHFELDIDSREIAHD